MLHNNRVTKRDEALDFEDLETSLKSMIYIYENFDFILFFLNLSHFIIKRIECKIKQKCIYTLFGSIINR